jgi:hypothetical protein
MAEEISQGAVHNLYYSDPAPESGVFQPTLQALSVKRIQTPAGNTTERYRCVRTLYGCCFGSESMKELY